MARGIIDRALRLGEGRRLKEFQQRVEQVNRFEPELELLDDTEVRERADELRQRAREDDESLEQLPEAFALVREASKRSLGQRHYDVQLIGGMVLHSGAIAEMKTGEGTTLTATLPIFLNTLAGNAVHLVTVNDYLARRDAEWMRPVYEALGVTVGVVETENDQEQRRKAYGSDITYGTSKEFGFDFLRDRLLLRRIGEGQTDFLGGMLGASDEATGDKPVQRPAHFVLVDEADSTLIDEARTPMIIAALPNEEQRTA